MPVNTRRTKSKATSIKSSSKRILLTQLPPEILIEIFAYLELSDVSNLALTCRQLSSIVNDTVIADKFTLKLDESMHTRKWIGIRRYSQVKLRTKNGCFQILRGIGCDIQRISLKIPNLDSKSLSRILVACPGLKIIELEIMFYHYERMYKKDMPQHRNLEIIVKHTDSQVFEVLKYVQTVRITYTGNYGEQLEEYDNWAPNQAYTDQQKSFQKFLKSQKMLKDLTLINIGSHALIFIDNLLDVVDFRLQSIKLRNFRIEDVFFFKFLDNHKGSIEKVDIDTLGLSDGFIKFLNRSPKFKEFSFIGTLREDHQFSSVTKLNLNYLGELPDVVRFPNLMELNLQAQGSIKLEKLTNLKKLEKLTIENGYVENISMIAKTSIKILHLHNVSWSCISENEFFTFMKLNLEELTIDRCGRSSLLRVFTNKGQYM